jgi:hypothetical protein
VTAGLSFDLPADAEQGGEDALRLRRAPGVHAASNAT